MTETTSKKTAKSSNGKKSMDEGISKITGEKTGSNESKKKKSGPGSGSDSSSSSSPDDKRKNYVRGEAQKPVTAAYRNNWNAVFIKKH